MAVGWAGDGAVQEQISSSIADEVARIRANSPKGQSLEDCEECGTPIPQSRREAIPGVRLCIECQAEQDKSAGPASPYNRRGNKDSQLR